MARHKTLLVVSLVLLAAGVAAANNLLAGPSPGLMVGTGSVVAQSTTPSTTTPSTTTPSTTTPSTTTPATTTPSTVGPSTGTPSAVTPSTTGATGTTTTGATANIPTIEQIVSVTRSVAAGSPAAAFTVPAGQQLVLTDVLITNPGATPACGAAISPSGAATTTTTVTPSAVTGATSTTTGTGESGTGLLCVPAQSSLNLGLTTGLEFAAGQSVLLANTASATGAATAATLHYHLRGFLMASGG